MSVSVPYYGPAELLTVEAAAARCYCSGDFFLSVYDGFRMYMGEGEGRMLRIPAWALHEWQVKRSFVPGEISGGNGWDRVADGEESNAKGLRARKGGKG